MGRRRDKRDDTSPRFVSATGARDTASRLRPSSPLTRHLLEARDWQELFTKAERAIRKSVGENRVVGGSLDVNLGGVNNRGSLVAVTTGRGADVASWPKGIGAITLFVEELEAAKQFYREVFGLPVAFEDD